MSPHHVESKCQRLVFFSFINYNSGREEAGHMSHSNFGCRRTTKNNQRTYLRTYSLLTEGRMGHFFPDLHPGTGSLWRLVIGDSETSEPLCFKFFSKCRIFYLGFSRVHVCKFHHCDSLYPRH